MINRPLDKVRCSACTALKFRLKHDLRNKNYWNELLILTRPLHCIGHENFNFWLIKNQSLLAFHNCFSRLLNRAAFLSRPILFKVWTMCNSWAKLLKFNSRLLWLMIGKFEFKHWKLLISWLEIISFQKFVLRSSFPAWNSDEKTYMILLKFASCLVAHNKFHWSASRLLCYTCLDTSNL